MKYLVLGAWSTRVAGLVLALWNQNALEDQTEGENVEHVLYYECTGVGMFLLNGY